MVLHPLASRVTIVLAGRAMVRAAMLLAALVPGVALPMAGHAGQQAGAQSADRGVTQALDGTVADDHDRHQRAGESGVRGVALSNGDIHQYYVPFDDGDLRQAFTDQLGLSCLSDLSNNSRLDSRVALTASSNATTVYYDHWEDGYDADPTVPGPTTQVSSLNAGQSMILRESSTTPHTPAYNGRDRITVVGQPAQAVRTAWPNGPGTRLAGAWEMARVSEWGRHYVIPIGEDIGRRGPQSFGDFDYVSAEVMAAYDNTVVQIDANADGTFERVETLRAGETAFLRGSANQQGFAIVSGARIDATLPVQVQVRAGNCRALYSGRSYTLVPVERWASEYWSPVASFFSGANGCRVRYLQVQPNNSADVDIYIYNPSTTPLPVTYEDASGTGVITIPARSTGSYLNLHPKPVVRSNTQGVHLIAPGPFTAVTAVDTTSLGNDGADFDWSYTPVPARNLSAKAVLSWAPGNGLAPPTGTINGSTAYVQAVVNGTTVKADLNGDGSADNFDTDGNGVVNFPSAYGYNEITSSQGVVLNAGQMVRVSDPLDRDMTGAAIYAQDNNHPLAIVYGEDACISTPREPFLDLGYTVLPLPVPQFSKNARLAVDADRSGDVSPGDTLEYTIQVTNNGITSIEQPLIIDTLPYTYTSFIIGSISSIPGPTVPPGITYDDGSGTFTYVPTGAPGTPDPLVHAFRANYLPNNPGQSIRLTLQTRLHGQIPRDVRSLDNFARLSSANLPPTTTQASTPINQMDLQVSKSDGREEVQPLDQLTYTLTYTNTGPGIAYGAVMTDTLPPTAINVSSPTIPGVITPTIQPGRIIFDLGDLPAGAVRQTTVSLTLAPNTPSGIVVNNVTIGARSFDVDSSNNTSTDIDRIGVPSVPVVRFSSADYRVDEDASVAVITATLDTPTNTVIQVAYATSDGTATSGSDYTTTHGTLAIPAGQTSATFTVPIVDDAAVEGDETVMLSLDAADTQHATLTIVDDDVQPIVYSAFLPLIAIAPEPPPLPDLVVDRIDVTATDIQVTIRNQGQAPATDAFWVDVYIDPQPAPTQVNQIWQELAAQGLVWGVTGASLPLAPGATLTLRIGDGSFHPELSRLTGVPADAISIYAQVDSANTQTSYGGVLETHEREGGAYNNISSVRRPAGAFVIRQATQATRPAVTGALPDRPAASAR